MVGFDIELRIILMLVEFDFLLYFIYMVLNFMSIVHSLFFHKCEDLWIIKIVRVTLLYSHINMANSILLFSLRIPF
jgi:hypothetical protein